MPITQADKKEWQAKKDIAYQNARLANRYRVFERDITMFLKCPVCKKEFDKYTETYSHIELAHQPIVQPREIREENVENDLDVEEISLEPTVQPQNDQENQEIDDIAEDIQNTSMSVFEDVQDYLQNPE